jgi:hypothetical protein
VTRRRALLAGVLLLFIGPGHVHADPPASCLAVQTDTRCPAGLETGTNLPARGVRLLESASDARFYLVGEAGGRGDVSVAGYDARTGRRLFVRRTAMPGVSLAVWDAELAHGAIHLLGAYYTAEGTRTELVASFDLTGHLRWKRSSPAGCADSLGKLAVTRDVVVIAGSCAEAGDDSGSDSWLVGLDPADGRRV